MPETEAALKIVTASLVFVDADIQSNFHSILSSYRCIVIGSGAHADDPRKDVLSRQSTDDSCMQDLIRKHMGAQLQLQAPADGAALICFTSGTSGPPKGVVISHTALHCQVTALLPNPLMEQSLTWSDILVMLGVYLLFLRGIRQTPVSPSAAQILLSTWICTMFGHVCHQQLSPSKLSVLAVTDQV